MRGPRRTSRSSLQLTATTSRAPRRSRGTDSSAVCARRRRRTLTLTPPTQNRVAVAAVRDRQDRDLIITERSRTLRHGPAAYLGMSPQRSRLSPTRIVRFAVPYATHSRHHFEVIRRGVEPHAIDRDLEP